MFRCPVCTEALTVEPDRYHCVQGHSFDRARDGSVHLLAGRSARFGDAGDSTEMLAARRRILDAGHYAPLREAVLRDVAAGPVLDVGCGEGYYTRPLSERDGAWVGAIDLAKDGIRAAARRTTGVAYAVANAADLPVVTASVDTAILVFAPVFADELARVLRPGGTLVVGTAGPRHLFELKQVLFDDATEHPLDHPVSLRGWSPSAEIERITYAFTLDHDDLVDLWTMTPYRWQVDRSREVELPARAEITADFLVCRYVAG
jgi:23S rRNA (guanine745-N1)-methyltransferase